MKLTGDPGVIVEEVCIEEGVQEQRDAEIVGAPAMVLDHPLEGHPDQEPHDVVARDSAHDQHGDQCRGHAKVGVRPQEGGRCTHHQLASANENKKKHYCLNYGWVGCNEMINISIFLLVGKVVHRWYGPVNAAPKKTSSSRLMSMAQRR